MTTYSLQLVLRNLVQNSIHFNSINARHIRISQSAREGKMILLNDDDIFIFLSGSKCNGDYTFTKGLLISGLYPLLLQPILPKMALVKPYPNATYDMSPRPIFDIDSEFEARISIFCLCQCYGLICCIQG